MAPRLLVAAALAAVAAVADPLLDCNFLSDDSCQLPWPSDQFLVAGRVSLTNISLPVDAQGGYIQPGPGGYDDLQGWSPMGPYVAYFADVDLMASREWVGVVWCG